MLLPGRDKLSTTPTPTGTGPKHEDDRDGARRALQSLHNFSANRQQHIWRESNQFGRIVPHSLSTAQRPAAVDLHVAAYLPVQLLYALHKCSVTRLRFRIVRGDVRKHPNPTNALSPLRPRPIRPQGQRPRGCRTNSTTKKLPPPHARPRA